MSANVPDLFTTQFSTNLAMRLQQQGSKLRGRVMEGSHTGKQASPVQYRGPAAMQRPAGRFAPRGRVDTTFQRRWVFPIDSELPQLVDSFDELKTIVDPKSGLVEVAANAAGREWDDTLIAAAFATAKIGTDASAFSDETFSTTLYQVADDFGAAAATGLTVAKMIEAKRIFRHNHVDPDVEPITLIIGSKQESELLNQAQVVSTDFNDRPVLVDGKVTRFMGFDIIVSERLDVASNVRRTIALAKSGMYLGVWKEVENEISKRTDLSGSPYQVATMMSTGATRLEPGRLVEIECANDTTGADITV